MEEEEEKPKAGIPDYPNAGQSHFNFLWNLWVTRARTFSSEERRDHSPILSLGENTATSEVHCLWGKFSSKKWSWVAPFGRWVGNMGSVATHEALSGSLCSSPPLPLVYLAQESKGVSQIKEVWEKGKRGRSLCLVVASPSPLVPDSAGSWDS